MNRSIVFSVFVLFVMFCSTSISFSQNINQQKFKLAESYEKNGDLENACRIYEEVFKSDMKSEEYFDAYIRSFSSMNRFSEIIPAVKERIEKNKLLKYIILYADLLWRTGKTSESNNLWDEAVSKSAQKPEDFVSIYQSQIKLQLYDKGLITLKTAREKFKNPALFADEIIRLYVISGDFKNGMEETMALLALDNNQAMAQGRIYAMMTNDDSKKFIKSTLKEFADKNQNNQIMLEMYAWYLRTNKEFDEALNIYVQIDKLRNSAGFDIICYAEDSRRDGEYETAMKAYSIVIDMGKKNPNIHTALFGYTRAMEDKIASDNEITKDEAKTIVEKYKGIIKEFPNTQTAYEARYRTALISDKYLNDSQTAIEQINLLIKERSNTQLGASALLLLGDIYLREGKMKDAQKAFNSVVETYSAFAPQESSKAKYYLAEIVYFSGDIDSSKVMFSKLAAESNTDIANDALTKLTIIDQNKELVKALSDFAKAEYMEMRGDSSAAVEIYKNCTVSAEGAQLAELCLKKIIDIEYERNNLPASADAVKSLLEKYPKSVYSDYSTMVSGMILMKENKNNEAIIVFSDFLEKFPRSIYLNDVRQKIRQLRNEKIQ